MKNQPTAEEFRTAAKVLRFVASMLSEERSSWPLWKRCFCEYPQIDDYLLIAAKMDAVCDEVKKE